MCRVSGVDGTHVGPVVRVRHLRVGRFRGILELEWTINQDIVGLVGAGDSFKTTVLDAIEWTLWPRWNLSVSDADFHQCDTGQPIVIEVTVSPLPDELKDDRSFGLDLRGWNADSTELHDEPLEGDEPALTIRLEVDESLEPSWKVVNDRLEDGKVIRARDRERLGVVRLGDRPETHFTWGRGSGLARLAESVSNAEQLLGDVMREARSAVADIEFVELADALSLAEKAAAAMGAGLSDDELNVQLDPRAAVGRASSLSLHRDIVPVASSGLGTRRLLGLAIQSLAVAEGAVLLIDEIESGLEPHRIRHLIRLLRDATSNPVVQGEEEPHEDVIMRAGQVFLTTHSPVAVCELSSPEVHVVHTADDGLTVRSAGKPLQALVRSQPEALLARRVVVCEGKTELGLIRGLEDMWASTNEGIPLAEKGVVAAFGGGTDQAAGVADRLAKLGYRCAFFADSDHDPTPTVDELEEAGVEVVRWTGSMCTEERLVVDLPEHMLETFMDYLVETHGDHVLDLIAEELGLDEEDDPYEYLGTPDVNDLRVAIAERAVRHKWLKRIDFAEGVGRLLAAGWDDIAGTDLAARLTAIQTWAYA